MSLFDLRGFSRVVIAAGDADYCNASIAAAEAVKDPLLERGVLVIPLVLGGAAESVDAPDDATDRRFRATPVYTDKWVKWIDEQKREAKVAAGKGVYVGLRMDGRVRSSGVGTPPWEKFAKELPPADKWGGFLDGFDGRWAWTRDRRERRRRQSMGWESRPPRARVQYDTTMNTRSSSRRVRRHEACFQISVFVLAWFWLGLATAFRGRTRRTDPRHHAEQASQHVIESNPAKMAKHKGEPWGPMKIGLGIAMGMFGAPSEAVVALGADPTPFNRPDSYDEWRKIFKNALSPIDLTPVSTRPS